MSHITMLKENDNQSTIETIINFDSTPIHITAFGQIALSRKVIYVSLPSVVRTIERGVQVGSTV